MSLTLNCFEELIQEIDLNPKLDSKVDRISLAVAKNNEKKTILSDDMISHLLNEEIVKVWFVLTFLTDETRSHLYLD